MINSLYCFVKESWSESVHTGKEIPRANKHKKGARVLSLLPKGMI